MSIDSIKYISILVSIFFSTSSLSSYLQGYIQSYDDFRHLALQINPEEVTTIGLGASHFFTAINPQMIPQGYMNLSSGSINYATQLAILKKNLSHFPNTKNVILELDSVPLLLNTADNRMGRFGADFQDLRNLGLDIFDIPGLTRFQKLYFGITQSPPFKPFFAGKQLNLKIRLRKEKTNAIRKPNVFESPGFWTTDRTLPEYNSFKALEPIDSRPESKYDEYALNKRAFIQMIQYLNKRQINLIFIRFPRIEPNTSYLSELISTLKIILGREIQLYDFETDKRFTQQHFKDPNHLNIEGARIFSSIISEILSSDRFKSC